MSHDLRDEIRQRAPFGSLEQEAFLNLVRTAAELTDALERVLRPHGITLSQYNVLRILRGGATDGMCRNELRDRMLTRMPDMTRLLDRMETGGLVARCRGEEDRRLVSTTITPQGRRLLDVVDPLVAEEHRRRLGHLDDRQLRTLIDLLGTARGGG